MCSCGCWAEYQAAERYAFGSGSPMTVSVEGGGYSTADGGYVARHIVESRDAWDFRSALKAARYLADGLTTRLLFSYTSRDGVV